MIVLDASAILALIHDEPGAELVAAGMPGSVVCSANLAEVVGKLTDVGIDPMTVVDLLGAASVTIEPLTAEDAILAGALRDLPGGRSLSLGDRCCLALALRQPSTLVLTADRAWTELELDLDVRLVR